MFKNLLFIIVEGHPRVVNGISGLFAGLKASYVLTPGNEVRLTGGWVYSQDTIELSVKTEHGLMETSTVNVEEELNTKVIKIVGGGARPNLVNLDDVALRRINIYHKSGPGPITVMPDEVARTQFQSKCL